MPKTVKITDKRKTDSIHFDCLPVGNWFLRGDSEKLGVKLSTTEWYAPETAYTSQTVDIHVIPVSVEINIVNDKDI